MQPTLRQCCAVSYAKPALSNISPALSVFIVMRKICTVWNRRSCGWSWFNPPIALFPPSWSVSSHSLCFFAAFSYSCLCQTFASHSLSLLTSSLKPTPWQPVAASPFLEESCSFSATASLWCHSNPMQPQTARHAALLTRNSQEGLERRKDSGQERRNEREWVTSPTLLVVSV